MAQHLSTLSRKERKREGGRERETDIQTWTDKDKEATGRLVYRKAEIVRGRDPETKTNPQSKGREGEQRER